VIRPASTPGDAEYSTLADKSRGAQGSKRISLLGASRVIEEFWVAAPTSHPYLISGCQRLFTNRFISRQIASYYGLRQLNIYSHISYCVIVNRSNRNHYSIRRLFQYVDAGRVRLERISACSLLLANLPLEGEDLLQRGVNLSYFVRNAVDCLAKSHTESLVIYPKPVLLPALLTRTSLLMFKTLVPPQGPAVCGE
jgi:hypothetical protein